MSTLSNFENTAGVIETDIIQFFSTTLPNFEHKVESEINTAATFLVTKALPWVQTLGQEVATDLSGLVGIVAAAGVGIPAPILLAATALNAGVTLVNTAIAAAQQAAANSAASGAPAIAQAVAAGNAAYVGIKAAQISTAQAQSTVASPVAPASVPAAA